MERFLRSLPTGNLSSFQDIDGSPLTIGEGSARIFQRVQQYALKLMQEEKGLNKELVDLELWKTSPSYSVSPPSSDERALSKTLRRLTDIICKDKGQTPPTTKELREVSYSLKHPTFANSSYLDTKYIEAYPRSPSSVL